MSFRGQIQPTTEVLGALCWQVGIQQVLVQDVSHQVLSQPTSLPWPPWSTSYNRFARKPLTPATDTCWLWAEEHPSTCSESDANAQLLWEINLFPVCKICGFTILLIQPQGAVNTRCFWNWGGEEEVPRHRVLRTQLQLQLRAILRVFGQLFRGSSV